MRFPSFLIWYKKPEYRDIKEYSTAVGTGKRPISPDGRGKSAVPSRLKLERVLENKTCSPMSLYDFYMYLKYIEFSPENLEFYIWFKNYETNYTKTVGPQDDGSLHSVPTSDEKQRGRLSTVEVPDFSCDPEIANDTLERITQLISPDMPCSGGKCSPKLDKLSKSSQQSLTSTAHDTTASLPLSTTGTGNRAELNAVIKTYLLPGSPKELNIPPAMRQQALVELQASSDPSHLRPIAEHVYLLLRNCSHRNFVRLGVSNGTFETICMATGLGIVLTIAAFMCVLLRAFTPHMGAHSRWDTFAAWPMWWLGISLILSGLRGSCFFLLLFSRRQPLPWERFDDSASLLSQRSGVMKFFSRLMIFDRKWKVQDAHLRMLQRKIVIQSLIGGAVFASLGVVLFICLPIWSETVRN